MVGLGPVMYSIKTADYQPTINEGIVCLINGDLKIGTDSSAPSMKFAHTFVLMKGGSAGYYVHN